MSGRILICAMVAALVATPLLPATALAAAEGGVDAERDLALWTTVVFVCLALVLAKFAWKPLAAALDRRERNVADQIAQAEAANQKAKDVLADYEQKLADAKNDVRGILDQGRRDAEKLGRELLDKAKEEATAEHARAVKQIEAAADAAVKSLADQSAAMAVELAGKIVHAKLNAADHAQLIEQAVGGFTASEKLKRNDE